MVETRGRFADTYRARLHKRLVETQTETLLELLSRQCLASNRCKAATRHNQSFSPIKCSWREFNAEETFTFDRTRQMQICNELSRETEAAIIGFNCL